MPSVLSGVLVDDRATDGHGLLRNHGNQKEPHKQPWENVKNFVRTRCSLELNPFNQKNVFFISFEGETTLTARVASSLKLSDIISPPGPSHVRSLSNSASMNEDDSGLALNSIFSKIAGVQLQC